MFRRPSPPPTMYQALPFYHSLLRWLVLAALLYSLCRAWRGYAGRRHFARADNATRHWTATIAHMQLLVGMALYFKSPAIGYFRQHFREGVRSLSGAFFGLIHPLLMLAAIVVLTIGSALAKRRAADRDKFRTMLLWYAAALLIIFVSIPWPFSPLAARPLFRSHP